MSEQNDIFGALSSGAGTAGFPNRGVPASSVGGVERVQAEVFRSLADHSQEFIGICDLEFKPFYVNEAGWRLVGLASMEEACAVRVQDFFFPEDLPFINHEFFPRLLKEGAREIEIRFRHFKTGAALWMIYNVFQVRDAQGRATGYATVSRNITERKRAEEALRRGKELSEAVNRIGQVLHSTLKPEQVIQRIVEEGVRALESDTGAISERKDGGWVVRYAQGLPEGVVGLVLSDETDRHAALAIETRDVVAVEDGFQDERFNREHLRRYNIRSVLVAPIIIRGAPFGAIFFNYHQGTHQFTEAELNFGRQLAAIAASALENARLFEERRRAESALRESEERLRLALQAGRMAAWEYDPATLKVTLSEDAEQVLELLRRHENSAQGYSLIHPEDVESHRALVTRVIATGGSYVSRYRHAHAERLIWLEEHGRAIVDPAGNVVRLVGVVQNITERKQAEEALRVSEERFRVAQELSPDGFSILRPMRNDRGRVIDFTWVYQNATAEQFSGKRLEQLKGSRLLEMFPEHRGTEFWEAYRQVAETGERRVFEACDGADTALPRWFRIAVVSVGGDIAVVAQDITKRREFQAELQRLVDERTARLQELVGELEHFSYTITHDLKSPLRAMRGFAEVVQQIGVPAEAMPFLEKISAAAARMDHLIADALSYSRSVRQELPLEDVDAGALLRGMLDTYPELQSEKARIVVEGRLPVVLANEAGLTQVFSNLLGNAVKFVKSGEKPDIRVWASPVPALGQHSEWVRIWVEDKGIGISKEMLPRVFDMFARASRDYEGTGIGLALVRKVAQRMGGKVGVESEEGKGSRFWIELSFRPAEPARAEAVSPVAGGTGEGTVLYVEDEESDALFMEAAFRRNGLAGKLRVVRDGRAAIQYLSGAGPYGDREMYPVPGLVLLDIGLPQVTGFGVLKWIRNHPDYARLPVVMFSSSTREDDRVMTRELGGNEFVTKPSSGLKFAEVVEGLQERWLGKARLS